jgi:transglutaminase-like putative cysteine protease
MKRLLCLLKLAAFSALAITSCFSTGLNAQAPSNPSRSFQFSSVLHVPAAPDGSKELRIWVPLPYKERSQSIGKVKINSPVPYKIRSEAEYGNRYAYFVVTGPQLKSDFDIQLTYHVQRFEDRVDLDSTDDRQGAPSVSTARFLKPDHLVPLDGEIAVISVHEAGGAALPLDKARRLYDYVVATMHYDHVGTEWGRGDAVWACDSKHGNCTDFHSLFIGLARAAGIPARFEIGFSIPPDSQEGPITSYHCWAQFYAAGIGWVPIDASEAWKHKEKKDYYYGALDPNRLKMSLGRDIRLNPPQKGEPLNYFVYPYAELDGKPLTGLKNEYSFKDDPVSGKGPVSTTGK